MKKTLLLASLFLSFGVMGVVSSHHASALALNPDPGPNALPGLKRQYLEDANNHAESPTITEWISPSGQAGATSMTVDYGTQTLDLEVHLAGVVGFQPSSTTRTQLNINDASAGVDRSIIGSNVNYVLEPNENTVGAFAQGWLPFKYKNPVPFTQSTHLDISITAKVVNEFIKSDGSHYYLCVGRGNSTPDITGGSCDDTVLMFGIDIVVQSVKSNIDSADCNAITGWALDMSQTSASIPVDVYVGGPAGSGAPGYRKSTDVFRGDVNSDANHGFNITELGGQPLEVFAKNGPTTFYLYAIGQYDNPLIGAPTIQACPPLVNYDTPNVTTSGQCQLVGWTFDYSKPDQSLNVDVKIDGSTVPGSRFLANGSRPDVNNVFKIPGNHGLVVDVPQSYRDGKTHHAVYTAYGIALNGKEDDVNSSTQGDFVCPIRPLCTFLKTVPDDVEPNQSFKISVGAQASAQAPPGGIKFKIDINIPGVYTGPTLPGAINPPDTQATVTTNDILNIPSGVYPNPQANVYRVTFTESGQYIDCPGQIRIASKPFFRVSDGDIASGFSNMGCTNGWAANPGRLVGWNDYPTRNQGAGTNLAIIALSLIDGVSSTRNATAQPLPLTYANANGTYGGSYGGTISCPKDYYKQASGSKVVGPAQLTVPSVSDVQATGDITLNGGSPNAGKRTVLYVNGNVFITKNITVPNTGVKSPDLLANFYLVVKGNIYVSPDVTQLDGVYVAQGNGNLPGQFNPNLRTGHMYTCAQSFLPPTADMVVSASNGGCRQKTLTINGAVIANKIDLYRSQGTVYSDSPAEIINYTPASWLALPDSIAPLFRGGDGTVNGAGYDAITSLQPVL